MKSKPPENNHSKQYFTIVVITSVEGGLDCAMLRKEYRAVGSVYILLKTYSRYDII